MRVNLQRMTVAEFMLFQHTRDEDYELIDGDIYAMPEESDLHARICSGVMISLNDVNGDNCLTYNVHQGLKIDNDNLLHPDVMSLCGTPQFEQLKSIEALLNPAAVFEVLSPSTNRHNRGKKFTSVQKISSVQHYVLIAQDTVRVECYTRFTDGWKVVISIDRQSYVDLSALSCRLLVDDIYRFVTLDDEENGDEAVQPASPQ